jgi:hypothetical protein
MEARIFGIIGKVDQRNSLEIDDHDTHIEVHCPGCRQMTTSQDRELAQFPRTAGVDP